MLKSFLKEVVAIVVGKPAEGIVDLLEGEKYVNEFIIAKKLDLTINQTRNILYKISDFGLVSSIRKKDKKKGWYTYFWKIEVLKSLEFLRDILLKNLNQLKNQIKSRETKRFYVCETCKIEFNEENAMLHEFICPECGEVFTIKDNEKVIKEFRKGEEKLEKRLEMVEEEINKEKGKIEKVKQRELRKIEKEKIKKRKESRKKAEKNKKKVIKKKVVGKKKKPLKKKILKNRKQKKFPKKKKKPLKNLKRKEPPKKKIIKNKKVKKSLRKKFKKR